MTPEMFDQALLRAIELVATSSAGEPVEHRREPLRAR